MISNHQVTESLEDQFSNFLQNMARSIQSLFSTAISPQLPDELVVKIILELDITRPKGLVALMLVSKQFCLAVCHHQQVWSNTRYRDYADLRLAGFHGKSVLLADQIRQTVLNDGCSYEQRKPLRIQLVGQGAVGDKLELALNQIDDMGYQYDGGIASVSATNNQCLYTVNFFCNLSSSSNCSRDKYALSYDDQEYLQQLRGHCQTVHQIGKHLFQKPVQEDGATVVLFALNSAVITALLDGANNKQMSSYMFEQFMDDIGDLSGRLIIFIHEHDHHTNDLDKELVKRFLQWFPQLAGQIGGVIYIPPNDLDPEVRCQFVAGRVISLVSELAMHVGKQFKQEFPWEITPFFDRLPTDAKSVICQQMTHRDVAALGCTSKSWARFYSGAQPATVPAAPAAHQLQADGQPKCTIM